MKKLLLITLAVILMCSVSAGSLVFAARHLFPSAIIAALRFDDCAIPCWLGIVPGKTTLGQAQQIILSAFANSPFVRASLAPTSPPNELVITLASLFEASEKPGVNAWIEIRLDGVTDQVIDTIRLSFSENSPPSVPAVTIGVLYSLFGAPDGIALAEFARNRFDLPAIIYGDDQHGGAVIFSKDIFPLQYQVLERYYWNQPVRMLELFAAGNSPITASWRLRPWRGFTLLERY